LDPDSFGKINPSRQLSTNFMFQKLSGGLELGLASKRFSREEILIQDFFQV